MKMMPRQPMVIPPTTLLVLLWMPSLIQSFHAPSTANVKRGEMAWGQQTSATSTSISMVATDIDLNIPNTADKNEENNNLSPLSMNLEQLTAAIGGKGRAIATWDCYRAGIDPLLYYDETIPETTLDESVFTAAAASSAGDMDSPLATKKSTTTREEMAKSLPAKRQTEGLGASSLQKLKSLFPQQKGGKSSSIEEGVAKLSHIQTSLDGTTKLLIQMVEDGLEVETVIIPWEDRGRSTLCLSSQVGCRQGCTFCATGRMGRLRSLTSDEILSQVYYSRKVCRVLNIPPVDNVVFMGMGEPADNANAVVRAATLLTDAQGFQMAKTRVTISTVGPDPASFGILGKAPVALAWSVHASEDLLRKQLVPTTKYTMVELRSGFVQAMLNRPKKLRTTMLEVALIDSVNDRPEDAEHLANFALEMIQQVPHMKLMVNLIPFNDIGHASYKKPSNERVLAFQDVLTSKGIFCFIRTTRGDDESAACGQLATKKKKKQKEEGRDQ